MQYVPEHTCMRAWLPDVQSLDHGWNGFRGQNNPLHVCVLKYMRDLRWRPQVMNPYRHGVVEDARKISDHPLRPVVATDCHLCCCVVSCRVLGGRQIDHALSSH